jgi:hypothetical protein
MSIRRTLLRGSSVVALAVAVIGSSVLAPTASASPLNKPKVEDLIPSGGGSGGGGIGDVPIIGDVANQFKDAEPEEIVTGVVQFAGVAAETVVPLIRGLIK